MAALDDEQPARALFGEHNISLTEAATTSELNAGPVAMTIGVRMTTALMLG